jgi:hypothetical protein
VPAVCQGPEWLDTIGLRPAYLLGVLIWRLVNLISYWSRFCVVEGVVLAKERDRNRVPLLPQGGNKNL